MAVGPCPPSADDMKAAVRSGLRPPMSGVDHTAALLGFGALLARDAYTADSSILAVGSGREVCGWEVSM